MGFGGLAAAELLAGGAQAGRSQTSGKAKTTILIWLSGGASHIDTWDMKPGAPREYRGPFEPIQTSAPGIELCEHLPLLAKQTKHLAIVKSLGHFRRGTGDHHAGYYYNLTGHAPDPSFPRLLNNRKPRAADWPFFGTVIGYKRPTHPYLPQVVSLPIKPGAPQYTRPGQFAALLGVQHNPLYVYGNDEKPASFTAPAMSLQGDVNPSRLLSRRHLLKEIDKARRAFDQTAATSEYSLHQQKAFSLLSSRQAKNAFDLSAENSRTLDRYGRTVNGMSMLMARRLAEAEIPCVAVFWKGNKKRAETKKCKSGGGWDTHGNNFGCLKDVLLPEFDRCFSALLEDLAARGLLDTTLVTVSSEMGRKTKVGDPRSGGVKGAGRDHWTHCMSALFAGGGIRGGQTYGSSDAVAAYPADRPVAPEDITKTIYHAAGINNLEARDPQGRPFRLLEEGRAIAELF
ncbi:MAG: DUF1501 domain-containing protein [Planctomycetes bacterium]|nr:DUF1501 domain-containing protein [Planctomycetota bacterium]